MNTNRRGAACGLLGGLWALVSCAARRPGSGDPAARGTPDRWARDLGRDYVRTGARAYSEEGIPVFLVGENLGPEVAGSGPVVANTNTNTNTDSDAGRLAAALRRSGEVLPTVRPGVGPGDVGKLIEVLADRDFGVPAGGGRSR